LAAAREILITKEAMDIIPAVSRIKAQEMKVSISGVLIPAYRIEYQDTEEPGV